jgi:hypothetical protein
MWGTLPVASGQQSSLTFSLQRNSDAFVDKTLRPGTADACDATNGYDVCLGVVSPGSFCGPEADRVEGTDPVVCVGVKINGLLSPLVDGDAYHLVVKDETGRTLVDDNWVATYTDSEPQPGVCRNSNDIKCRFADHHFSVQP